MIASLSKHSTIRNRLGKNGFHAGVTRQKPPLTKEEHKGSVRKHLADPPEGFWDDGLQIELFGRHGSYYIWHKPNSI